MISRQPHAFGAIGLTLATIATTSACARDAAAPVEPDAPLPQFALMCDAAGCNGGLVTDQAQHIINDASPITFAINGPSGQILAQTFTVGSHTRLGGVALTVGGCAPGSILIVEIRDLVGGLPTGALLGSATMIDTELAGLGIPGVFTTIEIRPPMGRWVTLTPGVKYGITLFTSPGGSCGSWPGPSGDSYAAGEAWAISTADPSPTWVRANTSPGNPDDLPFRVYMK
jgi:hypothetical protein